MPKTGDKQIANDWQWLSGELAHQIIGREITQVQKLLPNKFFATGLQLGIPCGRSYFNKVDGSMQVFVNPTLTIHEPTADIQVDRHVFSDVNQLPFGRRAADLIIMPHTLDLNYSPIHVLREVSQIIDDDGVLALTGFNPVSFVGASKLISKKIKRRKDVPPSYTPGRVKEWLQLIGFEVTASCFIDYLPPINHAGLRKAFGFFDKAGERWWPVFAGVYIIIAKKQNWIPEKISMLDTIKKRLNRKFPQPATRRSVLNEAQEDV